MEYKEFIKPGAKAILLPYKMEGGYWCWVDEKLVTIGEYKPYHTNGLPDPTPDEYDETCYVEIVGDVEGESQFPLGALVPFIEEESHVVYCGEVVKVIGRDEDDEYRVIEYEGKTKVVSACDTDEIRNIFDLSESELKELRGEIVTCSIYLSDYNNSFGIPNDVLSDYSDSYWEYLVERYGDEDAELNDTPEEFAEYILNYA
jgi:hypothetical protein